MLEGAVVVEHDGGTITVRPGEAVLARAGERVRYPRPRARSTSPSASRRSARTRPTATPESALVVTPGAVGDHEAGKSIRPQTKKNINGRQHLRGRNLVKKLASTILAGAVVSLVVVAFAPAAAHGTYKVGAVLTSKADVPTPKGAALAKGTFTGTYVENKTGAVLKWKLTFSHLTGPANAAHIHAGKPGVAGPVIVPLCGPCHSGQTGTVKISNAVIKALESGGAYINVHTTKNAGGEVRGQTKVTG